MTHDNSNDDLTAEDQTEIIADLELLVDHLEQDRKDLEEEVHDLTEELAEVHGDLVKETETNLKTLENVKNDLENEDKKPTFEIITKSDISLKNIGGIKPIKDDMKGVIADLTSIERIKTLRGKSPKHRILLQGPPGTGKTLLAKSLAGETGIPMIMTHGARFFETYIGKSREAIETMFDTGRKSIAQQRKDGVKNPAFIIFIDEIESLVSHRALKAGQGSTDGERIGEMLVQMDGKSNDDGLIILAATNHPELIDPAILDRFGKKITVPLPDVKGREEIFKIAAKSSKLSDKISLSEAARKTFGCSGRQIEAVLDQAASNANQRGLKNQKAARKILKDDFDAAMQRVMLGNKSTMKFTGFEKDLLCIHESGHAITGMILEEKGLDPLRFVTVLPHEDFLGVTVFSGDKESPLKTYESLKADLLCFMGGRAAEEIYYGADKITTGANGDIEEATKIAKEMVGRFGYSPEVGLVNTDVLSGRTVHNAPYAAHYNFMAANNNAALPLPTNLQTEIKTLLQEAYDEAKIMLLDNIEALHNLSVALNEREWIERDDVLKITNLQTNKPSYPRLKSMTPEQILAQNGRAPS